MEYKDPLPQPDYKESMETTCCLSLRYASLTFDEAVANTKQALKQSGFDIVSELALHDYFKQQLGKDINRYILLGACNAQVAYELLQEENKLGILMPCNVIIQDIENGQLMEVSIVDPSISWQETNNEVVKQRASEIKEKFKAVLDLVEQTDTSL